MSRPLVLGALLLVASACSGSSFNVTSADEAVGKAPSAEERSQETQAVETGFVELSECPDNASWTERFTPAQRVAVNFPSAWSLTETPAGLQLVHPKGWLSMQLAVRPADDPAEAVKAHRDAEFEGAELLAEWSDKAHHVGRVSDGVLSISGQMLIVRYLISETHFLEASVATDRPLNEDCRKHVVKMMSSVELLELDAKAPERKPTPDSDPKAAPSDRQPKTEQSPPETVPQEPIQAAPAPLNLHPTRTSDADSEPASHDLDTAPGVAAAKEQGVDQ